MSERRFACLLLAAALIWPLLLTLLLLLITQTPTPAEPKMVSAAVLVLPPPAPPPPSHPAPRPRAVAPHPALPAKAMTPPPPRPQPPAPAPAAHPPAVPVPTPPPTPPSKAPQAVSLGRDDSGVKVLHQEVPDVPDDLAGSPLQVQVALRFLVHADGSFTVKLLKSCGQPELDAIALQAAQRWRFAPAVVGGVASAAQLDVVIPFEVD